jgi:amidase
VAAPKSQAIEDFASAVETAAALRAGRISASDLVSLTFQRIDRHNPALNAIVWQDRESALARARQADDNLARGREVGPLHGVPVTIKDSFAYRGSPSHWGLPPLNDALSPRTAPAIERLESAGAIVLGKTNVPVMLGDWQSFNPIHGATNNPWDVARTPGGSTGGGAAAVAAGLGSLTMGSDIAGSIRIPAHFCGVYGHKPSFGLVSMAGFQPGPWDGSPGYPVDLVVAGPLARDARDLAVALAVLGGPDAEAARAWSWRLPPPRRTRLQDFRIGYILDDEVLGPIASDIRGPYEDLLAALTKAGARIERGWPPGLDLKTDMKTFHYLLYAFVTADAGDDEREQARKRFKNNPKDVAAAAAVEPHARWIHETQRRLAFRARWQRYFESHDVFLIPPTFTAAFPHDHSMPMETRVVDTPEGKRPYMRDIGAWIGVATLAGLPVTVAPVGRTSTDLPVGIQIVGPMWEDATPIEFAALLADAIGGFVPPPAFRK